MAKLDAVTRKKMKPSEFAQPKKKGFPLNDPEHQRLAIGGATRAARAGNISGAEAARIKAKARAKLAKGKGRGKK